MTTKYSWFTQEKIVSVQGHQGLVINEPQVKELFTSVDTYLKEKGYKPLDFDQNLWKFFEGKEVVGTAGFAASLFWLENGMESMQMLDVAHKMEVQKIYSWLQAMCAICTLILAGAFDEGSHASDFEDTVSGIAAFYTDIENPKAITMDDSKFNGRLYLLRAERDHFEGQLPEITILTREIDPWDSGCVTGYGILFNSLLQDE